METTNKNINSKIKKILSKAIAEEWIAGQLYLLFNSAVKSEERNIVSDMFLSTADDEIDDHMKSLVNWATTNEYPHASSYAKFKQCADPQCVKQFESFKEGRSADYYLKEAIKAEIFAIKSYEEMLNCEELSDPEFVELQGIIANNFYDELQHLGDFNFLLTSYETTKNLIY